VLLKVSETPSLKLAFGERVLDVPDVDVGLDALPQPVRIVRARIINTPNARRRLANSDDMVFSSHMSDFVPTCELYTSTR
jgi:hypothetical protein